MEIKDFIENFAEQFDDTTVEMLSAETKFRELDEWSSLIALSVIAMVDEVYGITINGEDIRSSQTISDLFNRIADRK
ncbi:phosphopantetheine-binding protein [Bacteroides fluxus]|uniref:phosphopantetheine-binding protein n=1 Tax=Bacteroides fluxus TaxID=626930 RepID=UPI0023F26F1D|nr:phosphopantetheine-binding protein [Bacteroides fluxus]